MDGAALIWIVVGIACLAAEALTFGFVMVYFGLGAIAAGAAALLGAPPLGQAGVFVAVSIALLAATRRLVVDWFQGRDTPPVASNVNTLIGKVGLVTIPISNDLSTGQIRVGTEFWTARIAAGDGVDVLADLPQGSRVEVVDVRGVTALVRLRELPAPPATSG